MTDDIERLIRQTIKDDTVRYLGEPPREHAEHLSATALAK